MVTQPISENAEDAVEELKEVPLWKKMYTLMEEGNKIREEKRIEKEKHQRQIEVRITKQLKIWVDPEVKETQFILALAEDKFVDPRTNLNEKCIYIGRAEANLESSAILSYCLPGTDCARSLCFYVPELTDHIEKHVAEKKQGNPVNIWEKEIKDKLILANLPGFAAQVQTTMSTDWVELIKLHSLTLKFKADEVKDSFSVILFNKVTEIVCGYFEEHPEDLSKGTVFKSTASTVNRWFKRIVKFPFKLLFYVLNNPFTANICIFLSKALRACVCAYMSGVTGKDIRLYLKTMWSEMSQNIVIMFILEFATTLYTCISEAGFTWLYGDISGILKCFTALINAYFDAESKIYLAGLRMFKNLAIYLAKKILTIFVGKKTADFVFYIIEMIGDGITNPKLLIEWWMQYGEKSDDAIKQLQLISVFRDYFFLDFHATVFWGVVSSLPAEWLDYIMAIILPLIPTGGYFEKAKDRLMNAANNLIRVIGIKNKDGNPYIITIGDVLIFCLRQFDVFRTSLMMFYEVYGWFRDIGGCFISKFFSNVQRITNMMRITSVDLLKEDITTACCFKDMVLSMKNPLVPTKPPGALTKLTQGIASVASKGKNVVYGTYNTMKHTRNAFAAYNVLSMISDARLKHLMKPIFALKVEGKILRFWMYKLRPNALDVFPGADTDNLYIGLVAQEVQRAFPDAVSEKKGYLMINMKKLPCNAHAILAGLNGFPMPRKCTTKPLLLPANHYRAHSKKIRY